MSIVMKFAFLVEMVLFSNSFTVVKSAVGVWMLPLYSNLSPPTHIPTRSVLDFVGLWVHTIVMYVTFLPAGTLERGMKKSYSLRLCCHTLAKIFQALCTFLLSTYPCIQVFESGAYIIEYPR